MKNGMQGTMMPGLEGLRLMKLISVGLMGAFALLVGLNNLFDYQSNFMFVQHVLSMDTTFEGNALMWRALEQSWLHHLAYAGIITLELATGVLCCLGAVRMFRYRAAEEARFYSALQLASWGLMLGIILWFGGFMIVGAEWFLMWQSESWNGQEAAFRFIMCLFASLIFIQLPERQNTL